MGKSLTVRVFARNTEIRIISNDDKNEFLNKVHIQGSDVSQINLGAFYGDTLVAVMTFCRPRILMNKTYYGKDGYWELSRFATLNGYHVVGGASKLLTYFKRNYDWKYIYSFADMRWSSEYNNVYLSLGFLPDTKNITSEYHYVIDGIRKHRWGFRRDALKEKFPNQFNPAKTEYENMLSMGIDRVWDCGGIKYILEN